MKRIDLLVLLGVVIVLLPFSIFDTVYAFYNQYNADHGMITSFLKFAVLATFGEALGLRIRTGRYNYKGFGLFPRAIVWGFLGLTIKLAFVIFATGTPVFLAYLGLDNAPLVIKGDLSWQKVLVAFSISTAMNLIFAPVMMTFHKITDIHIVNNGGSIPGLFKPIKFGSIIAGINWKVQWDFVFKKTIPFFWVPAHTITFLLPVNYQVLFAAILGVALGVLLAFASLMGEKKQ